MCNLNLNCPYTDGSCNCIRVIFPESPFLPQLPSDLTNSPSTIVLNLIQILYQQNEILKNISRESCLIKSYFENLRTNTDNIDSEPISSLSIEKTLNLNHNNFKYSLKLINELPSPAYKDRSFGVFLQVYDLEDNKIILPKITCFKIMLFAKERPLKMMQVNTNGEKIFRGNTETKSDSTVLFKKIAIKEVSSHFRSGAFFFVVSTPERFDVKPLILDEFVVKARKINTEELIKKKRKINDQNIEYSRS